MRLARDYGTFMLRNALALAVVLGVEDPPPAPGRIRHDKWGAGVLRASRMAGRLMGCDNP